MLRIALLAILLPFAAQALPDHQLRYIQQELKFQYLIDIDTTQLTAAQASAIFLKITSERPTLRNRQRIKTIIRRGKHF